MPNAVSALQPKPNMQFNPAPTAPGKCSKLKVSILLDSTTYVAGGNLNGRLELHCSSNKSVRLGEIAVELTGLEEVTARDHAASQSFLSARIVFQGDKKPPTNAVRGQAEGGYWQANKGKTTFPFSFQVPVDAPSWYQFQNVASLRYVVTGIVQFHYNGKNDTLIRSKDACVYENWRANHPDIRNEPIRVRNNRPVWFGGPGQVHLEGAIKTSFFCSGNDVYVEVRVRNESKRRVSGVRLSIVRRLLMGREGTAIVDFADGVKVLSETVNEWSFREKDYNFDPGENRSVILHVTIPPTVRTVRNTALAALACRLIVSLNMGTFAKDLTIDLPIDVCHSASILPPPEANHFENSHPQQYNLMSEDEEVYSPARCRSPSPARRIGQTMRTKGTVNMHESGVGSPPKGVRALPWSDDEGDAEEFDRNRREQKARGRIHEERDDGLQGEAGPASPIRPPGGLLREVSPGSPPTLARTGVRAKGVYAKSPLAGPTSPTAYVPATVRSRYIEKQSIHLDAPGSPSQIVDGLGSPAMGFHTAVNRFSPKAMDPIALPSPVMAAATSPGRRPPPIPVYEMQNNGFFDPPSVMAHQYGNTLGRQPINASEYQQEQYHQHQQSQIHPTQHGVPPAEHHHHRQSRPLPPIPEPEPQMSPVPTYGYAQYFFDKARQAVSYAAGPIWAAPAAEFELPPGPQHNAPSPQPHPAYPYEEHYNNAQYMSPSAPIPAATSPYHSPQFDGADQYGDVPAQYKGMSPPLSPRPEGYVSKYRRRPKPLPSHPPVSPHTPYEVHHQQYEEPHRVITFADERVEEPEMRVEVVHVPTHGVERFEEEDERVDDRRRMKRYSQESRISRVSGIEGDEDETKYLDIDFDFEEPVFDFSDNENFTVSTMKTRNRKKRPTLDAIAGQESVRKVGEVTVEPPKLGTKGRSTAAKKATPAPATTSAANKPIPNYAKPTTASAAAAVRPPLPRAGPSAPAAAKPIGIKGKGEAEKRKSKALSPKIASTLAKYARAAGGI